MPITTNGHPAVSLALSIAGKVPAAFGIAETRAELIRGVAALAVLSVRLNAPETPVTPSLAANFAPDFELIDGHEMLLFCECVDGWVRGIGSGSQQASKALVGNARRAAETLGLPGFGGK